MPDPRAASHQDRLNRFWNELIQPSGAPDASGDGLDPAAAETVRRLHALGAAPPPASSRERVRRAVRAHVRSRPQPPQGRETPMTRTAVFDLARPPTGANGRTAAPFPGRPRVAVPPAAEPRRWGFAPLAAALLVLTLGLGFFTLGPGRQRADGPVGIPAIVAPATPAPAAAAEVDLLTMEIPEDLLPTGDQLQSGFSSITVAPGEQGTWPATRGACCPGLRFDYVLAGSTAVRPAGAARLVRAGGTPEEVSPGTEVVLGPGDALLTRDEDGFAYANRGTTRLDLLFWGLHEGTYETEPMPPGWAIYDFDLKSALPTVPAGPATLRLRRVELAAAASLPAPLSDLKFGVIPPRNAGGEPARLTLTRSIDGTIKNSGETALPVYVLTLEPAAAAATPVAAEAPEETLAVLDLPAAMVPSAGSAYWGFTHSTLPPGAGLSWDAAAGSGTPGVRFEHVLAGVYTIRLGEPARVLRAGGTDGWEAVSAGSEVVLQAGDTIGLASQSPYEATNGGAAPVEVVEAILTSGIITVTHPEGWEKHDIDQEYTLAVPDGPAVLRLRRASLEPRTTLPPLPGSIGQVAVTLEAEAALAKQTDGALRNIADRPLTAYVLTLEPPVASLQAP